MWKPEVLADATGNVRNHFPDPLTGVPANRTLGLVQAGDDGRSQLSGAWAAPSRPGPSATTAPAARSRGPTRRPGSPSAYLTNGLDQHAVREPRRTTALASLAAVCTTT